jgi:[DsrC]-trisulfide reductase subunit K
MTTATKDIATVKSEIKKRYNRLVGTSATNLCTHCGWCIDACHVFLATNDPSKSPVAKAEKVRKVLKKDHDWLSKLFPSWTGAEMLTEEKLDEWLNAAFRDCTLCERCVINCPMGVETPQLLGMARGALSAVNKSPEILYDLADMAIEKEAYLAENGAGFRNTILKLEQTVQEKLNDPAARIPVQEEADMLYVPLSGAHTIIPAAIVFNKAKASWTMSMFEASNYGLFLGDTARAKKIVMRIINEAKKLNVKEIIVTECGHAYGVLKWEAPKWFGGKFGIKVRSILEVYDEFLRKGLIEIKHKSEETVTYHDPCNMGRKGGIFEEPREVIKASTQHFVDMVPNRVENYCCGAGGGMVASEDWKSQRLLYGKVKAGQIKKSKATKVITACDNCLHQIKELSEHYDLNIKTSNVSEHLAEAII